MSDDEKFAINHYSMNGYKKLNKYLRMGEGKKDPAEAKYYETFSKILKIALDKLPSYKEPVFRGNKIRLKTVDQIDFIKNLDVGDEYEVSGFDSYSADMDGEVADNFVGAHSTHYSYLSIYEGKNAKDITAISDIPEEDERIIPTGTRLKVSKVKELNESECDSMFPEVDFRLAVGPDPKARIKLIYFIDA
jgi:hypothetical protein